MDSSLIVGLIFAAAIITMTAYAAVVVGGQFDDRERWNHLLVEMNTRYPNATYKAKLEFMRRDRDAALKDATGKNDQIADLTEDYQLIIEEQERIEEGMRQLGAEFDPFVANKLI